MLGCRPSWQLTCLYVYWSWAAGFWEHTFVVKHLGGTRLLVSCRNNGAKHILLASSKVRLSNLYIVRDVSVLIMFGGHHVSKCCVIKHNKHRQPDYQKLRQAHVECVWVQVFPRHSQLWCSTVAEELPEMQLVGHMLQSLPYALSSMVGDVIIRPKIFIILIPVWAGLPDGCHSLRIDLGGHSSLCIDLFLHSVQPCRYGP